MAFRTVKRFRRRRNFRPYPRTFRRRSYAFRHRLRRRRVFPKRRHRVGLFTRVRMQWNKPVLVRLAITDERKMTGSDYTGNFILNMELFNSDEIRQQLYGYQELFDQFKIVREDISLRWRDADEYTKKNTAIPEAFWAYDPDMNARMIDIFNIQKLQNFHQKMMPVMSRLKLKLRPRWKQDFMDTTLHEKDVDIYAYGTGSKMGNPWFDSTVLTMDGGQAPALKSANGWAICIKDVADRTLIVHNYIYVLFRGRKNNQSYKVPSTS